MKSDLPNLQTAHANYYLNTIQVPKTAPISSSGGLGVFKGREIAQIPKSSIAVENGFANRQTITANRPAPGSQSLEFAHTKIPNDVGSLEFIFRGRSLQKEQEITCPRMASTHLYEHPNKVSADRIRLGVSSRIAHKFR
jgi:hypothetical protein